MVMTILSKLTVGNNTILTLDGDVLLINSKTVIINGKEYCFDIAYDLKNSIGINDIIDECSVVQFVDE